MPGIASAATAVVIGHVAAGTSTIRVGAGGIMLPNHAPLVIAEQFGTLAALYPGRIDLGLGRAPGTDMVTARALRRNLDGDADSFPQDVVELIGYFRAGGPASACAPCPARARTCRSGSSARASTARSSPPRSACPTPSPRTSRRPRSSRRSSVYRSRFQPSEQLASPYVMLGLNVFAADTDAEARRLVTSLQQAFVNLRTGRPGRLPPPVDDFEATPRSGGQGDARRGARLHGRRLAGDREAGSRAISSGDRRRRDHGHRQIFDHAARLRSFAIAAAAWRALEAEG